MIRAVRAYMFNWDSNPALAATASTIPKKIRHIIMKQKYDLAKFFRLTLDAVKANTIRRINPTQGIENRSSYPKYPHIEIGAYSGGIEGVL